MKKDINLQTKRKSFDQLCPSWMEEWWRDSVFYYIESINSTAKNREDVKKYFKETIHNMESLYQKLEESGRPINLMKGEENERKEAD